MIYYAAVIAARRAAQRRLQNGSSRPPLPRQKPIYLYEPYTKRKRPSPTDPWYRKLVRFITFDHLG